MTASVSDGWSSSEWDELFRGYTVGLGVAAYAGERSQPDPERTPPTKLPLELKKTWDGLGFWDPDGVWWDVQTHLPLGTRSGAPEDGDLWIAGPIRGTRCAYLDDAHLARLHATGAPVRPAAVRDARGTIARAALTPLVAPPEPQTALAFMHQARTAAPAASGAGIVHRGREVFAVSGSLGIYPAALLRGGRVFVVHAESPSGPSPLGWATRPGLKPRKEDIDALDALCAIGEHVRDFPMADANDVRVEEVSVAPAASAGRFKIAASLLSGFRANHFEIEWGREDGDSRAFTVDRLSRVAFHPGSRDWEL